MNEREVEPRLYTTVIREMIRHENDVTNHRIMWLLIAQGLIANAYVMISSGKPKVGVALAVVGILITISTYIILYKSYHARGYLDFLGRAAKAGTLKESQLPLMGWPGLRIKDWRREIWCCHWISAPSDLLEPYLFLPIIVILAWMIVLVRQWLPIEEAWTTPVSCLLTLLLILGLSVFWVRGQQRTETESL